jgi:predicted dehydrogenase/RimJ/RimL family protein N-acetyltransferase
MRRAPEALDALPLGYEQAERYTDYGEMLDRSKHLDAVVIGTPQHLHVEQSVAALERGLHVLSEVPAGVSVEECRRLAQTCHAARGVYMMAENYIYTRPNVLVRELARQGLFGDIYYAEGEYLHELKGLAEQTTWRRHWQMGIDGVTYPTHSLGPILQWMPGDRVVRVSCEGSGHHYHDPRGEPYHQDTAVMLCKTARGALIKIRTDLVSERPHAMTNYQLQGTDGVYESARGFNERNKIWLRALSQQVRWHDLDALLNLDELAARYLPDDWRNPPQEALRAGHGGGDWFEVRDWVRAIRGEAVCPIGVHEALDMTLPGLVSQQSIRQNGAWLDVPDSRAWASEIPSRPQLHMLWPERLLASPPVPNVPDGYRLRLYADTDEAGYLALMNQQDFGAWDADRLARARQAVLPGGFFVIEHAATGKIVATAQAGHRPEARHPEGGELGWVAGDPEHAGRSLGRAVVAAATARLIEVGYRRIYLKTEDHRLPALKIYLSLGYEPFLYADGMADRWQAIRQLLNERRST